MAKVVHSNCGWYHTGINCYVSPYVEIHTIEGAPEWLHALIRKYMDEEHAAAVKDMKARGVYPYEKERDHQTVQHT